MKWHRRCQTHPANTQKQFRMFGAMVGPTRRARAQAIQLGPVASSAPVSPRGRDIPGTAQDRQEEHNGHLTRPNTSPSETTPEL